jgi:hypothetical protein
MASEGFASKMHKHSSSLLIAVDGAGLMMYVAELLCLIVTQSSSSQERCTSVRCRDSSRMLSQLNH